MFYSDVFFGFYFALRSMSTIRSAQIFAEYSNLSTFSRLGQEVVYIKNA